MARDLTHGSILKNLLHMSLPTMMGYIAHTLYDLLDMVWIGFPMLRIITPSYIFFGITFGFSSGFMGAGYNTPFMISAMIARWGVQIPFMILTVYLLNLSVTFIWVSFALSEIAGFVVTTVIYRKGTWKTRRVSHLIWGI